MYCIMSLKCRKAFTLAEVLITLGIIGIVAALTIPNIAGYYRWKTLETAFYKGASSISQALDLYQVENGERFIPVYAYNDWDARWSLKPILMKYFKIIYDCGFGSENTEEELEAACLKNYVNVGSSSSENLIYYKNYNNTNSIDMSYFDEGQFIISDGMLILLEDSGNSLYGFTAISIDVNGLNSLPNRLGYDLFMFQIDNKNGRLKPMGAQGTNYYSANDIYCSKTSTNKMNGAGCTYKAISDSKYFKNLNF